MRDEERRVAVRDLEWKWLIGRARHAGEEALDLRIARQPVRLVLLFLLQPFGPVRQLVALDHAESAGDGADRAECDHFLRRNGHDRPRPHRERGLRTVRLDVPIRGVDGLPDSVEVWLAVEARNGSSARLSGHSRPGEKCHGGGGYSRYNRGLHY